MDKQELEVVISKYVRNVPNRIGVEGLLFKTNNDARLIRDLTTYLVEQGVIGKI